MVDTAQAPPPAAGARRRRAWWRTVWVIAPAVFLVLLGVTRLIYWRQSATYSPLQLDGLGAPAAGHSTHATMRPDGLLLGGRPGTDQLLEFPVRNTGDHPLTINEVSVEDSAVVGVLWSTYLLQDYRRVPTASQSLPARLQPHTAVELQLVVRKPSCSPGTPRYLSGVVTINWSAMVSTHSTTMDLLAGDANYILLCAAR